MKANQHSQSRFTLNQFKDALHSHSQTTLGYLRYLMNPINVQQFNQHSQIIFKALSQQLIEAKQKQHLSGLIEFIMATIFTGHVHVYQKFNKTFFVILSDLHCDILSSGSFMNSINNDNPESQNSKTKVSQKYGNIQFYKAQLAEQVFYLMAKWLPHDFSDSKKDSIYYKIFKDFSRYKDDNVRNLIYHAKYLKNIEKKMIPFYQEDIKTCFLCLKIATDKNKIIVSKNLAMNSRRLISSPDMFIQKLNNIQKLTNQRLSTANSTKILEQPIKLKEQKKSIVAQPRLKNRKCKQRRREPIHKQYTFMDYTSQDKKKQIESVRFQLAKISSTEQLKVVNKYDKNNENNKSNTKYLGIKKSVSPPINVVKNLITEIISKPIKVQKQSIQFRKQLGRRATHNKILSFKDIPQLASIQYKIYKGIIKIMYALDQPIKILSPDNKYVIKHNASDGYYLIDNCKGLKITIEYIKNKQHEMVDIPIGLIKQIQESQIGQWELDKTKLMQQILTLDYRICRSMEQLAKCLGLQRRSRNNQQKYELIAEIGKIKFKLCISEASDKILVQGWCAQNLSSFDLVQKLMRQIKQCYASKC